MKKKKTICSGKSRCINYFLLKTKKQESDYFLVVSNLSTIVFARDK